MAANFTRKLKNFAENQQGVAGVEFALVSMGFIILIVCIMEFGVMVWTYSALQDAAQFTARHASINTAETETSLQTLAENRMRGMLVDVEPLDLDYDLTTVDGLQMVDIQTTYEYAFKTAFFLPDSFSSIQLSSRALKPVLP